MMKKLTIGGGLLAAVLMVGCGDGTSLFPDLGTTDDGGTSQDAALTLYKLQSGTYQVTSVSTVADNGCYATSPTEDVTNGGLINDTFPLTNDGEGKVSLGELSGTPEQPSQGMSCPPEGASWTNAACATATVAVPLSDNVGTLVRDNQVDLTDNNGDVFCTFNVHRESQITITADNTFTASYTETRSNPTNGCDTGDDAAIKACTVTWTWTLAKQ